MSKPQRSAAIRHVAGAQHKRLDHAWLPPLFSARGDWVAGVRSSAAPWLALLLAAGLAGCKKTPEEHLRRVREWARSSWEAWRAYHPLAQRWVHEVLEHPKGG